MDLWVRSDKIGLAMMESFQFVAGERRLLHARLYRDAHNDWCLEIGSEHLEVGGAELSEEDAKLAAEELIQEKLEGLLELVEESLRIRRVGRAYRNAKNQKSPARDAEEFWDGVQKEAKELYAPFGEGPERWAKLLEIRGQRFDTSADLSEAVQTRMKYYPSPEGVIIEPHYSTYVSIDLEDVNACTESLEKGEAGELEAAGTMVGST